MLEQVALDNSFRFRQVREQSESLCAGLSAEDCNLQAMPDTSPLKWHLAHTTWFFETFILLPFSPGYRAFDESFQELFNSYYNGIGKQHPRPQRHLLSRPGLDRVFAYRSHTNQAMVALLERPSQHQAEIHSRLTLGLNHEQQHQELMLTDLKYNFFCSPLLPAYSPVALEASLTSAATGFEFYKGGLVEIGQDAGEEFGFDNEMPRHKTWLEPFALGRQLVSNHDYRAFIEDGGYRRPELWLSDGWSTVKEQGWTQPLYWDLDAKVASVFTLHGTLYGTQPLRDADPVAHLSYFEADAFARWKGARLPTEAEWEHACHTSAAAFQDQPDRDLSPSLSPSPSPSRGRLQPLASGANGLQDLFGSVWQWTASAYLAYPGYRAPAGALGEYNGKFMCGQFVLRGSSCVTARGHSRPSYRNFFYPADRWQFTGLRLARDAMPG